MPRLLLRAIFRGSALYGYWLSSASLPDGTPTEDNSRIVCQLVGRRRSGNPVKRGVRPHVLSGQQFSTGKSMGRKQQNIKLPPFVAIPWAVLNSAAYRSMSYTARSALPYFLGKPKVPFNRTDYITNDFQFTYPEAGRLGYARSTFHGVIEQLVRYGFIDPVDKGGLRGHGKTSSLFKLSSRWQNYGTEKFLPVEWREFQPKDEPQKKSTA